MRNLIEYPITLEEVESTLQGQINDLNHQRAVGGTQVMILTIIKALVKDRFTEEDFSIRKE